MLKTILIIIIFGSAMTILGQLIPQQITGTMNDSFKYFIGQINNLRAFSQSITSALIISIQFWGNFLIACAIFLVVRWILHLSA